MLIIVVMIGYDVNLSRCTGVEAYQNKSVFNFDQRGFILKICYKVTFDSFHGKTNEETYVFCWHKQPTFFKSCVDVINPLERETWPPDVVVLPKVSLSLQGCFPVVDVKSDSATHPFLDLDKQLQQHLQTDDCRLRSYLDVRVKRGFKHSGCTCIYHYRIHNNFMPRSHRSIRYTAFAIRYTILLSATDDIQVMYRNIVCGGEQNVSRIANTV